jgi:hypothetical protein
LVIVAGRVSLVVRVSTCERWLLWVED